MEEVFLRLILVEPKKIPANHQEIETLSNKLGRGLLITLIIETIVTFIIGINIFDNFDGTVFIVIFIALAVVLFFTALIGSVIQDKIIENKVKKYDQENPNITTENEIWLYKNRFVIKKGKEQEILIQNVQKVMIFSALNDMIVISDGYDDIADWGYFELTLDTGKTEKISFQMVDEEGKKLFKEILCAWYLNYDCIIKERTYLSKEPLLLFQKDWEIEKLNAMKKKLGIDTIY